MFRQRHFVLWELLLLPSLFGTSIEASTCGRDPSNIVAIRDDLAIAFCSDRIVRVVRGSQNATQDMMEKESLVIDPASATSQPFADFEIETNEKGDVVAVSTKEMLIQVITSDENSILSFLDRTDNHLFTREVLSQKEETGGDSQIVSQSWESFPGESLYGGGQYVNGFLDYKAAPIHMVQANLEIVSPFFMSSAGYAILLDNYGETWLNPPNRSNQIDLKLNSSSIAEKYADESNVAVGSFSPPRSGDYWFSVDMQAENSEVYNPNKMVRVTLKRKNNHFDDPKGVTACHIEHHYNVVKVLTCKATDLEDTATYTVSLEFNTEGHAHEAMPLLFYRSIGDSHKTEIQTSDSDFIDYYFMTAPKKKKQTSGQSLGCSCLEGNNYHDTKFDSLIAAYRQLTGPASLFSKKAYGFWQCKEHYHNQKELLDAAAKHRELGIPVDNIVQDAFYWGDIGWGPHWDPKLYPDPKGMIKQIHEDYNLNIMVSVWSKFDMQTKFYKEMLSKGLLINGTNWFDAWDPAARRTFFRYMDEGVFSLGGDAVWLDATEPESDLHLNKTIFLGSGNKYRNTYSLEASKSFYEGFTAKYGTQKRPFALTRSGFAGQHRFATIVWSGDTKASFEVLERQIAMSINYQMSGDPYWTMDTGGFFRPADQYSSPDYQMLLLRWFQFAVFTPIMRLHGANTNTELWNFGNETQSLVVESSIDLRYRLIPYIYSGFRRVQEHGYTMSRGLAFDFLEDRVARNISDQFMFGESFLVAPIYNLASNRTFYLPSLKLKSKSCGCSGGKWRDFYTGLVKEPGRYFASKVDPASMLLFVRSSIVVLAPKSQHVHDSAALKSLEVRIYVGKDSTFTLFDDDGVDPDPSRPWTKIKFDWSDKRSVLTIRSLEGEKYPGMPQSRVIDIVVVRYKHGVGVDETEKVDASVVYKGREINVNLNSAHREARGDDLIAFQ